VESSKTYAGSSIGVDGKATVVVPIDCVVVPFGKRTVGGSLFGCTVRDAAIASSCRRNILSAPVSAQASGGIKKHVVCFGVASKGW